MRECIVRQGQSLWHIDEKIEMREPSIREMRERLGNRGELAKTEGEILITRRDVPIARLLPMKGTQTRASHSELRVQMPLLDTPSQTLVRDDRDQR